MAKLSILLLTIPAFLFMVGLAILSAFAADRARKEKDSKLQSWQTWIALGESGAAALIVIALILGMIFAP